MTNRELSSLAMCPFCQKSILHNSSPPSSGDQRVPSNVSKLDQLMMNVGMCFQATSKGMEWRHH